ncbi:MAG: type 1 glutamine amidotransferase [Candidatus Magasanikbacteria bacterium]
MSKQRKDLNILYMQIRKDELTANEEFAGFKRFMKLDESQFHVWNVFAQPNFDLEKLESFDAMVIGGTSDDPKDVEYLGEERYPFLPYALRVIKKCYDESIPVCASCMGFLLILQAFETKIEIRPEYNEGGFAEEYLTEYAKQDPLFAGTPDTFTGISFHSKSAATLPDGAELLLSSDECPITGFTFPDKPFYAFQFHPEFDDEDLIRILARYADRYKGGAEELEKCKQERRPSTYSNEILTRFVDRIILGEN